MDAGDYLIDHSLLDWQKLLASWEWLLDDELAVSPWLMSRFGDLFFVDEAGVVSWLNVSDGEVTEVAKSEAEFVELLDDEENAEDWFQIGLVDALVEAGKNLEPAQCFGFKLLPVLGGEYAPANVYAASIEEYWAYCGDLHEQVEGLPDGTEIEIDVPER